MLQFESEINTESNIIDVRNNGEYANGHLTNSVFRPLDQIHQTSVNINLKPIIISIAKVVTDPRLLVPF